MSRQTFLFYLLTYSPQQPQPQPEKKCHKPPFYGRGSNGSFSLSPTKSHVKSIGIWSGWASGDASGYWVLKGIKLSWVNGDEQEVYNHRVSGDKYETYTFQPNETADFSIVYGYRVVGFGFTTSTGNTWFAGGGNGTRADYIAKGYLVGFVGSSGWEIDSLALVYDAIEEAGDKAVEEGGEEVVEEPKKPVDG